VRTLRSFAHKPAKLNEMGERGQQAVLHNFMAKRAAETVLTEMSLVGS